MHELNSLTTQIRLDEMNGRGQSPHHVEFRLTSADRSSTWHLAKRISDTLAWVQTKYLRSSAVQAAPSANSTHLMGKG